MMPSWIGRKSGIWGKTVKFCSNIARNWKSLIVFIFDDALLLYTVVVHYLNKDISYDDKLINFKICPFWSEIVKLCAKVVRNWNIFVVSILLLLLHTILHCEVHYLSKGINSKISCKKCDQSENTFSIIFLKHLYNI